MGITTRLLRPLRGSNLEIFKFGLYLAFPIGWMYYFGTNLDERFNVPEFWPTKEQSHTLPYDREELRQEVQRMQSEGAKRRARLEGRMGVGEGEGQGKGEGGEVSKGVRRLLEERS
jgi:protein PET100, fungi type